MNRFNNVPLSSIYLRFSCPEIVEFLFGLQGRYEKALTREIHEFCQGRSKQNPLKALFIGSFRDTPSARALLLDTSGTLSDVFTFDSNTEITVEAEKPALLADEALLKTLKSAGVNRLSIKIYFPKDVTLQPSQRRPRYDVSQLGSFVKHASKWFDNINVDVVIDQAKVCESKYKTFFEQIVTWPIAHVSLYEKQDKKAAHKENNIFAWSAALLQQHGYYLYDFPHFARHGYESRANAVVWDREPYKGFGWGASSFDGTSRFINNDHVLQYMEQVEAGQDIVKTHETLTPEQIHLEKLMTGLRRVRGMERQELFKGVSQDKHERLAGIVTDLIEHAFICERDGRLLLTPAGMMVENQVISKLLV